MRSTVSAKSSDRLIAIVESFVDAPRQSLSEVSAACGIDPSTATRYLRRLVEHGWLERDEQTRAYTLGVRLITVGQAARTARPLRARVLPHMRELLARFDETVNLALHEGGEIVIIEALESGRSIRRGASVGDRDDWFVSSLGKCVLAHLPERAVEHLMRTRPPVRRTRFTRTEPHDVLADLAAVRERGYALDDEESEIGLKCVGVPIRDDRGQYSHALSVSGPTARIDERLDELIAALTEVAHRVGSGGRDAP
ncbi:IclR family transcriptional regulator [Sphaerisporangium krabiense]|uniref:IclR family acetate operon transcriptional repressor n=1 Tax=Sphaerisporangium krabiense TaxID=763782 RepID=A0A7W8Z462_9ACTN|nr:IclR family transcriptional regulator [Sphaerisporangium krabiense]MBB5627138.1 IclR family acetate operon transcriptional repressor [Sphaerisporangium krabiense]